jgi:glycosyltransferase involved in cell wall biosynthesis
VKLLHLIHTPRHSGAEMLVRDLCLAHAREGLTCAVAAFEPPAEAFAPELVTLAAAGVALYMPQEPLSRLGRVGAFAAAIKAFGPDVVFGHSVLPAIYGRLALLGGGSAARFVSVLHSGTDDYGDWKLRGAERLLQGRTDAIVAVSQSAADVYTRHLRTSRPLEIILNGVDLARFYEARHRRASIRKRLGLAARDRLILQVGRVGSVKQQLMTARTLTPMLQANERLRLWFVGIVEDPDYCRRLTDHIAGSGLGERMRFLGPRLDVPDLLSAADVYVMPSRSEAHSIAFLEAMASGAPIVATDIESFQFAKGLEGIDLVGVDDEAALGQAVGRRLVEGQRHRHAMSAFDLASTAEAYRKLAENLCRIGAAG